MKNEFFDEYNRFEDTLIARFHKHSFYQGFKTLSREQFRCYLLQVGFISEHFVHWYEVAKFRLNSEVAKEVVRVILRDEIPAHGPTHQDDRQYDLRMLNIYPFGMSTRRTRRTIRRLFHLINSRDDAYNDLWILVVLRVAGEVLVSEQYKHVIEYAEQALKNDMCQSRFYVPHYEHDRKRKGAGHTGEFDELLAELIDGERALQIAKEAAEAALVARLSITDQFVPHWWDTPIAACSRTAETLWSGNSLQKAAGIALCGFLLFIFIAYRVYDIECAHTPPTWEEMLASLPKDVQEFYLDADKRLGNEFVKTGDRRYLAKIGTSDAVREVWGEGP